MKVNVSKLKDSVKDVFDDVLKYRELKTDPSLQTREMLKKHNPLQSAILRLLGTQYRIFIRQIDWVAPKPTTFRVVFKNSEIFYLKWLGKQFQAQISGKRYDLAKEHEYQQALDAISELLKYAPPTQEGIEDFADDDKASSGGGSGGSATSGNFPGSESSTEGEFDDSVDVDVDTGTEDSTVDIDTGSEEDAEEEKIKKSIPTT